MSNTLQLVGYMMMEVNNMSNDIILKIKNLKVFFPIKKGIFKKTVAHLKAVDNISFEIKKGTTMGLVGESGCGKTTTGKAIVKLVKTHHGEIFYRDNNILNMSNKEMKPIRAKVQMIFQDPFSSLNPRMTVGSIIAEPLKFHNNNENVDELVDKYMKMTGLRPEYKSRYPHEFSGGQRQRIGIARALATNPELIIADEPVSALDVSIQAQIINLLKNLQKKLGLTYLFIAHDLSVVKHISDEISVMYLGNIVEISESNELYKNPLHPYTKALISSIPVPDPRAVTNKISLEGELPSPIDAPVGCKFVTRCKFATELCQKTRPKLITVLENHKVACHHWKAINN